MQRIAAVVRASRRWVLVSAALGAMAACSDPTASVPDALNGAEPAFARNARATSSIVVTVSGVSAGSASVRVTGPGGYSRTLTGSATLGSLANGTYTVAASTVTLAGVMYTPTPLTRAVSVSNGSVGRASVTYAPNTTTGALTVSVTMPDATPAAVTVTGPNAFSTLVTSTRTISSLAPGTYTVTATTVTSSGGTSYTPTPATQSVSVASGSTSSGAVVYASVVAPPPPPPPPSTLNFQIAGMYITQSVQSFADSVPLVAGRDGVLRVFALANLVNTAQPAVRVRIYRNGTLINTLTAIAPTTAVPLVLDETVITRSWNFALPGSLITGGLSILADVDPTNAIAEGSETDNTFPVSGVAKSFNVRAVPNFAVKFVPLYQDSTLKGNVSAANTDAFLQRTRDMHPINTITTSVRAPYTTSLRLASDGTNWSQVLSELRSVQVADGASETYYGVAKVTYSSGVAGIGYIGAPASMGWDYLPSGSEVMAHELGHNWGRQHAPCGGVAGADGAFPYSGGTIGTFGFNVRTNTLIQKTTSDLMGYCSPTWVSDYTYLGVMRFRGSSPAPMVVSASSQPGLLVWGRITASGAVELEPAIRLDARPSMPSKAGAYQVQGTDANGVPVFSLSFDPEPIADETGRLESTFAFIVPLSDAAQDRLTSIAARGKGRSVLNEAQATPQALTTTADNVAIEGVGAGRARARWNSGSARMVVVRDASTGEILSFARGGDAMLRTSNPNLEVIVSDGVRSTTRRVTVKNFR